MNQGQFNIAVRFGGSSQTIELPVANPQVADIAAEICSRLSLAPATLKLLGVGKGSLVPSSLPQGTTASDAGLKHGARVMVVGSRLTEVETLRQAESRAANLRLPGFEHEAQLHAARRRRTRDVHVQPPPAGTRHTFGSYEVMRSAGLQPGPEEALKLLHRLASDHGIMAAMDKHGFDVGKLAEMPPEGQVGVDPVCVLGYNTNRGESIYLRLRTDDLKGFRKYEAIRATLCHELTHNVWGDHDNNFKTLCSQINKEVAEVNARYNQGGHFASLTGHPGWDDFETVSPELHPAMAATAGSSGKSLRQLAKQGSSAQAPPAARAQVAVPGFASGVKSTGAVSVKSTLRAPASAAECSSSIAPGSSAAASLGVPGLSDGRMEQDAEQDAEQDVAKMYEHYDSKTEELEQKQRALEQ